MRKLGKHLFVAVVVALLSTAGVTMQANRAEAQVGVHIGIDVPVFPRLVVVPGYPVYYAPDVRANYFFYDGFFWTFNVDDGCWYSSTWYNGPWVVVEPAFVPQPILVVPYRFYRVRPVYWGGWAYDRPPRWDVYWGADWVSRRPNWDRWDRSRRYTAAPLPLFERDYRGGRYPAPAQQINIYRQHYNYRPRDVVLREHETTIIDRQSRGGERASSRAEWLGLRNEERTQRQANIQQNRQTRENTREQDRAQRQSNAQQNRQQREAVQQQDRAQRQAEVQQNRQQRENNREQDKAQRQSNAQQNRQQREAVQQQDRAQHQAEVQQNRQQRENNREQDKAQRQSNAQQNRQQREAVQQQDRTQRQANAQAERQRQENGREQRQANVQQNRQQRENIREQDRGQREANVQANRQSRESAQAERGQHQGNREPQRESRDRKGGPEKGQIPG